jgi:hypothetical protein
LSTPWSGGEVGPAAPSGRTRSWPFAAALVLFVVVLGLLPHLRFSLLVGEPACFFAAYDEDQYSLWALGGGGPLFPHRWLSAAALTPLKALGGSWDAALILADAVFPAACALLAWMLAGQLTRRRLLRILVALGLLFAQELLSFGCWTVWHSGDPIGVATPDSPVYDLRYLRETGPGWLFALWPDSGTPYLTLYRTPEPQISRIALFAMLVVLISACRVRPTERVSRPLVVLGLLINAGLAGTYFSQAAALVAFEGLLCLALLWLGSARARVVGVFAAAGAGSLLLGAFAYWSNQNALGLTFASRLPVLTPSVAGALAGLLLLATVLRGWAGRDLYPVAAACFGTVLVLTNQQLVTGRMVLSSTWERYVDYPLVFQGAAIVVAWLLRERAALTRVYAFAGAALVLAGLLLVRAQDRLFQHEYLVVNLESVAMRRAVEAVEARGVRGVTWLLADPARSLMLQARLGRRIDHFLDITNLFLTPVDSLSNPEGAWALRSPHLREVFEYLARRPRTPGALARQLRQEADGGAGDVLRFLFDYRDFWAPMTDGRRTRTDEVRAKIPEISDAFARYLETGDPCWSRPVVVLTRQGAADRGSARWDELALVEATVGVGQPIMNMNAYLQTLRGPGTAGAAQAVAAENCDSGRAPAR